jgi:hypothetical protein
MSTRKSSRPEKKPPAKPPTPPAAAVDIDAMLMVGEERVHIDCEEDDNLSFMAEQID